MEVKKQKGIKQNQMALNYMVNHSILNIVTQNSNQGPMFEESNGKFGRSHSEGTEKEHCIYNEKKYFKSL